MSANGLAGGGTTGGDAGPARGAQRTRAQRARAERGATADIGAPGVPATGHVRKLLADPRPGVEALADREPGPTTDAATPAQVTTAPGTAPEVTPGTSAKATPGTAPKATPAAAAKAAPGTAPEVTPAAAAKVTSEATAIRPAAGGGPERAPADAGLFARYIRDYVTGRAGQQVMILQAGCTTADGDPGAGAWRAADAGMVVSLIDDDQPVTRAAVSMYQSLAECVQSDLRTVPLPQRSQDIVVCPLLLQRIEHAELVLDRLVTAIKPGGLLLLRFRDRDSAAGFLDRVLPVVARRAIWRKRHPGQPGPYPAVYERLSSARGVQAYALMRGLVIAERQPLGGLAGAMAGPFGFLAAQKLIARLSRGRLTDAHEDLLYVLRKPESRFARVL
jgi:Methyltransferase domain